MIDLHSHILPGLDDGATDIEMSLEIARSAVADGIHTIAATPHVRGDWPTSPERMEDMVALVRNRLRAASIPLELLPGAEIALDVLPQLDDDALRRFGLAGNPSMLLIETPYLGWPLGLAETLFQLRLRGFRAVLAHPERNGEVQDNPRLLESLVAGGLLVQLTAASVDGRLGRDPRNTARRLIELRCAHLLASDGHAPSVRATGLTAAAGSLGDESLAHWMTVEVPDAIVSGTPIPHRPEKVARFGLRRRRER